MNKEQRNQNDQIQSESDDQDFNILPIKPIQDQMIKSISSQRDQSQSMDFFEELDRRFLIKVEEPVFNFDYLENKIQEKMEEISQKYKSLTFLSQEIVKKKIPAQIHYATIIKKDIRKGQKQTYVKWNIMMKNWIKKLKNQELSNYEKDYRGKLKNRCYLFVMLAKIQKLELFDQFMTDFPILIEKKIEEVMKEEVSSGYKKLLCQEFGFLIECLNQFNENQDLVDCMKTLYIRGRVNLAPKTKKAIAEAIQFLEKSIQN